MTEPRTTVISNDLISTSNQDRLEHSCVSAAARVATGADLEEEPASTLGFVDPHFDQARRRDVAPLVADVVRLAQARRQRTVVLAQLRDHVGWLDIVGIVVSDALYPADVSDRLDRGAADFPDTLRD